jgi:membrane protease YdiL (CAAX protease family)
MMNAYPTPQYYYEQYQRRTLRRTANSLGVLLLSFFAAELILATVVYGIILGVGVADGLTDGSPLSLLMNGVLSALIFFFVSLIHCLIKRKSFAALFPFEPMGAGMLTMLCVIGLAVALMSNYASDWTTGVFSLFGLSNNGGTPISDDSRPSVLLYYLTVALLPALAEEFAFRGVIMGTLRPYSEPLALLISSATFALMHGNFVQIPFTFCCGLVFGFLVLRTNSLLPAIIVHFLNNGLSVTYDVLTSYEIITPTVGALFYGLIFFITSILALIFLFRLIKKEPGFFLLRSADKDLPFRVKMKTVASSPALITFASVMMLYAIIILVS